MHCVCRGKKGQVQRRVLVSYVYVQLPLSPPTVVSHLTLPKALAPPISSSLLPLFFVGLI